MKFENIFEETLSNRQNECPSYFPNGAIYVYRKNVILEGKYYTKNSYSYIMPRERSIDIDELADFKYVEYLLQSK